MSLRLSRPQGLVLALAAAGVLGAGGTVAYTSAHALSTPAAAVAPLAAAPTVTLPDFSAITARSGPPWSTSA